MATTNLKNKKEKYPDNKLFSRITELDVYLFKQGKHYKLYEKLGSFQEKVNGIDGCYFSVWAPNGSYVSVICDYNYWDNSKHPMKARWDGSGIWEAFIPNAKKGMAYKYYIVNKDTGIAYEKFDPFSIAQETPPKTASLISSLDFKWSDKKWMNKRGTQKAFSIYEVHLGSWMKVPEEGNRFLTYIELADKLVKYVSEMGFTHVEFMPITEHPFYGSWGYQTTGYFAPTSRYGSPNDFAFLINSFHKADIGVILDWVPSHFPEDEFALNFYDGTHLYEHSDPRKGFHPDWKSSIFNYGRFEVRSFLISSAIFWLDKFHIDAIRVDAVASMLYLDYSRKEGDWIPNEFGGNENLEAISFLKEFNEAVYAQFPDIHTIAEESTAWPGVSKPTSMGGLGFGMKWMMGWMHDTLEYFKLESIHRKFHQNQITFSIHYAFTENYCLPLSHDEVVYGKKSLLEKMPGDDWQKFANLRLLYTYMYTHPGIKLIFMGGEIGQRTEWNHEKSLDWHLLQYHSHKGLQESLKELNQIYKNTPALSENIFSSAGFEFLDFSDTENSVVSYFRKAENKNDFVLVVLNFTPVVRENYILGVPVNMDYEEIYNSDNEKYWGSNVKNYTTIKAIENPSHGRPFSLSLTLPPLAAIIISPKKSNKKVNK
ncbi:MAG: 1,4-alpha-glucan branching protein GlgB [Bacteroidota bacterium]|jgi:1,4-alpha-glucan branching enzyme